MGGSEGRILFQGPLPQRTGQDIIAEWNQCVVGKSSLERILFDPTVRFIALTGKPWPVALRLLVQ